MGWFGENVQKLCGSSGVGIDMWRKGEVGNLYVILCWPLHQTNHREMYSKQLIILNNKILRILQNVPRETHVADLIYYI